MSAHRLVDHLRGFGQQVAVATADAQLTYAELAERVAGSAAGFGDGRKLVLIEAHNTVATLTHYLGALAGGHVAMPVPAGTDTTALVDTYDPDVTVDGSGASTRRNAGVHRLHPDVALLLSTSGSTGSPQLVRLSYGNLLANACAIAKYLDIRQTDFAATTLPMSYCYGLSVIHTHLLRGAGLILTDHSVLDTEFWELFRHHRGTSFAGVPFTFELLDKVGFDTMSLPDLRYVTQAGGRLPADRVRRFAALGRRMGWELVVMYGATEATARMSYLPAELAHTRPESIGRPIPGGSFTIDPLDGDPDVGELVYRGPNVMMGYAQGPRDLADGHMVDALRTGDLARRSPDGLYELVGRRSRFAKLYGLRIDLQQLESSLGDHGLETMCTADDDGLVVAVAGRDDTHETQRIAAESTGVPLNAIRAVTVPELPRLASGKPDYAAVRGTARERAAASSQTCDLRGLFAEVLHIDPHRVTADSSFVELGGNSLSYVAMTVRLERLLGTVPTDWHRKPVQELEALIGRGRARSWFGAKVETSVALRAAAVVLIVGSHAELFQLWGGAHILLGIAGYNFGRFCLTPVSRVDRMRHLRNAVGWIAIPSIVWIAVALVITNDYHFSNLLLMNKILGPHDSMTAGRLWFVEVLVWILVALAVICWLPIGDRLERGYPFGFAMAFLVAGLALRYDLFGLHQGRQAWFSLLAFWFFALGWAAAKATTPWQRVLVTVMLIVGLHGYFLGNGLREALVMSALVLLIWIPAVRCPAALITITGLVAEASLYTYLTHFQVYELFKGQPLLGVAASIAAGVALTQLVSRARTWVRRRVHRPLRALTAVGAKES